MSSINATISAQLWLPLSSGKQVFTSFVPIGPCSYQQASPSGNPNDTLHSIYTSTPISRIIPTPAPAAVPFTPASISSLKVWFSGDVGLTSGAWTNQVTGGPSTGVTSFSGMNIVTVNGLNAAHFALNGYGTYMQNLQTATDSRSMFCVFQVDSPQLPLSSNSAIQIVSQTNSGFYGGWSLQGSVTGFQNMLISYGQAVEMYNTTPIALTTTNVNLFGSSWETTNSGSPNNYVYLNTIIPSTWSPDQGFNDGTNLTPTYLGNKLGTTPNGSSGWTLCEICIYGRSLTPAEGAQLQSYLKTKWNSS
jgi:hypothetical protein